MKLDKPTIIALITFAIAMLGILAAKLAGELTTPAAISAASGPVMVLLGALGVISHGTPSKSPDVPLTLSSTTDGTMIRVGDTVTIDGAPKS